MTRLVLFAGFSAALAYLSRASLTTPRSHGFYRFLAWESIVALAVLNFRSFGQWFGDPLGLRQLVSWVLLFGSIVPAAWGAQALRTRGRPRSGREDGKLFEFEKTTQLVTTGPFTYVRHPLYSSLLLLAWGVFFKRPTVVAGALALCATAFLVATARAEESENLRYFGDAYRLYMQKSKMFVPFVL
jgi:protein-S-isoprenylcysteine O-methyltransferase Ste14